MKFASSRSRRIRRILQDGAARVEPSLGFTTSEGVYLVVLGLSHDARNQYIAYSANLDGISIVFHAYLSSINKGLVVLDVDYTSASGIPKRDGCLVLTVQTRVAWRKE